MTTKEILEKISTRFHEGALKTVEMLIDFFDPQSRLQRESKFKCTGEEGYLDAVEVCKYALESLLDPSKLSLTFLFAQWIGEKQYSKHQCNDRWYDGIHYLGSTAELWAMFKKDADWHKHKGSLEFR